MQKPSIKLIIDLTLKMKERMAYI